MSEQLNTPGDKTPEAAIQSNLDAMEARGKMPMEDQLVLANAGVPVHQSLPADWRDRLATGRAMDA